MTAQDKITAAESLLGALAVALPKLDAAKKNSANPHFKSKYADLGSVIEAIRPIADYGLWFRQVSHESDKGVCIETFYIHDSGELSAGKVFVPADKGNAQGFGSAQTYARRYGLQMAFGLATEDDDGNAASTSPPKSQTATRISNSDWAMLVQLVEATNTNTQALCEAYKVASLKDLTSEQFTAAKSILEKRLSQQAEATREPA